MPPYRHFLSLVGRRFVVAFARRNKSNKQIGTISPPYACYVANTAAWSLLPTVSQKSKVTAAASAADTSCGQNSIHHPASMFNSFFSCFGRRCSCNINCAQLPQIALHTLSK